MPGGFVDWSFIVFWKELKDAWKDSRMAGDSNWRIMLSLFKLEHMEWRVYVDSTVIVKELDVSDVVTFVIGSNTACQMISVLPFI